MQVATRLRSLFDEARATPMSPELEAEFARFCEARLERLTIIFSVSTLLCCLVWWPTDYFVYRDLPSCIGPFAVWRATVSVLAIVHLVMVRTGASRHYRVAQFGVGFVMVCATMGYAAGLMGGPEDPQLHCLYVLGFATVPVPLRLKTRVVLTIAFCAAVIAGCLVPFPELRASPHVPMTVSCFIWIAGISITFGHVTFLLLRSHFLQAALLADSNALLERRVAERTRELRDLLSQLETTREEERNRIARELHDQIGQELTAQRLTLAIAEDCLDSEPATARVKLAEMRELLGGMMGTVRGLIGDLRPWILHDLGLGEAAQWLSRRTEELAGIRCDLRVSGDPTVASAEASAAVFRILQESLNNVTKHAHARVVTIDLVTSNDALELRVTDDGIGPLARASSKGFGVLGMRERAQALGGDFTLEARPGGGTEVTCRLPRKERKREREGAIS